MIQSSLQLSSGFLLGWCGQGWWVNSHSDQALLLLQIRSCYYIMWYQGQLIKTIPMWMVRLGILVICSKVRLDFAIWLISHGQEKQGVFGWVAIIAKVMMKLGGRPAGWDVLSECPLDSKRPLSVFGCVQVVSFHGGLKPSTSSVFLNSTKAIEVVEIAMIAVKISGDRMLLHPWRHEFLQVCAGVCSSDAQSKGAFQLCPKKRHANSANSSKMCLKLSLIMFQVSPHDSWQLSTISRQPVIIARGASRIAATTRSRRSVLPELPGRFFGQLSSRPNTQPICPQIGGEK